MTKKEIKKQPSTEHYNLYELFSAIQKSIRRGLEEQSLIFALELEAFNPKALWNRFARANTAQSRARPQ